MSNFWHRVKHLKRGKCFNSLDKVLSLDAFQLPRRDTQHQLVHVKMHLDIF